MNNLTNKEQKVLAEMLQDINEDLTRVVTSIRKQDTYSPIENVFRMAFQILANEKEYKVKKCKVTSIAVA